MALTVTDKSKAERMDVRAGCNPWGQCVRGYNSKTKFKVIDVAGQGDFWMLWSAAEKFFSHYLYAEESLGNAI